MGLWSWWKKGRMQVTNMLGPKVDLFSVRVTAEDEETLNRIITAHLRDAEEMKVRQQVLEDRTQVLEQRVKD